MRTKVLAVWGLLLGCWAVGAQATTYQTVTSTSHTYTTGNNNYGTYRSNSGGSMLDTLPDPTLAGNGWYTAIGNNDYSSLVITATNGSFAGPSPGTTYLIPSGGGVTFCANGTSYLVNSPFCPLVALPGLSPAAPPYSGPMSGTGPFTPGDSLAAGTTQGSVVDGGLPVSPGTPSNLAVYLTSQTVGSDTSDTPFSVWGNFGASAAAAVQTPFYQIIDTAGLKLDVYVIATANVSSLSGAQAIDGVTPPSGSTVAVLLPSQSTTSQNGLWDYNSSGAWTRSLAMPTGQILNQFCDITATAKYGNTNKGRTYTLNSNSGAITVDTTAQTWGTADSLGTTTNPGLFLATDNGVGTAVQLTNSPTSAPSGNGGGGAAYDCASFSTVNGSIGDNGSGTAYYGPCQILDSSGWPQTLGFGSPTSSAGAVDKNSTSQQYKITGLSAATSLVFTFGSGKNQPIEPICSGYTSAGTIVYGSSPTPVDTITGSITGTTLTVTADSTNGIVCSPTNGSYVIATSGNTLASTRVIACGTGTGGTGTYTVSRSHTVASSAMNVTPWTNITLNFAVLTGTVYGWCH